MKPKIYLAGPMRGLPDFNFPAFDAARNRWICWGYDVTSPADMDRAHCACAGNEFDPSAAQSMEFFRSAMARDCAAITKCDFMALLPGWERSKGARVEIVLAHALGMQFFNSLGNVLLANEVMDIIAHSIISEEK